MLLDGFEILPGDFMRETEEGLVLVKGKDILVSWLSNVGRMGYIY